MTATNQQRLGQTLWAIADQLRGAMNADDFRDILDAFLNKHAFDLPALLNESPPPVSDPTAPAAVAAAQA